MTKIEQQVADRFKASDGKYVDVLYVTSDGKICINMAEASDHIKGLPDKKVTPFYRDTAIRTIAKGNSRLQKVITATDFCKQFLAMRKPSPSYDDYVTFLGSEAIPREVFEFVRKNVYRAGKAMYTGEKDKIYMWDKGIVDVLFLRRYPEGQIFMYGDTLVLTCPTNTELVSGTFQRIFSPTLGKEPS